MKLIDLSIVEPTKTDARGALQTMMRAGRTAVLVKSPTGYTVLVAARALEALGRKAPTTRLADLTLSGNITDATAMLSPGGWPGMAAANLAAIQARLKATGGKQLLIGLDDQHGTGWLAVDDDLARHLEYPLVICTCPADPSEVWQPFEAPDGLCPVHRVQLNCS